MKGGLRGTRTSLGKSIMGQRANYQRALETQAKRSITPGRAKLNMFNAAAREAVVEAVEEKNAMNILKNSVLKLQTNIEKMESAIAAGGARRRRTRRKQSK